MRRGHAPGRPGRPAGPRPARGRVGSVGAGGSARGSRPCPPRAEETHGRRAYRSRPTVSSTAQKGGVPPPTLQMKKTGLRQGTAQGQAVTDGGQNPGVPTPRLPQPLGMYHTPAVQACLEAHEGRRWGSPLPPRALRFPFGGLGSALLGSLRHSGRDSPLPAAPSTHTARALFL